MPRPLWTVWSTRPSGCNPAHNQHEPSAATSCRGPATNGRKWVLTVLSVGCRALPASGSGWGTAASLSCCVWRLNGSGAGSEAAVVNFVFKFCFFGCDFCCLVLRGLSGRGTGACAGWGTPGTPGTPESSCAGAVCPVFKRLRIFVRAEKIAGLGAPGPLTVASMQQTHCNPDVVALHCMHARCCDIMCVSGGTPMKTEQCDWFAHPPSCQSSRIRRPVCA